MSKREIRSFAAAGVDVDAPRAKRRKEAPAAGGTLGASPDGKSGDAGGGDAGGEGAGAEGEGGEDPAEVKEKGMQVWCALRDAVNKDGQIASFQFMRLPSKRQYPDYYALIKRPVALDDIKSKLERREYPSLEDLRQDFDTCFRNAKRYNMKESQIWKDAKFLHKLASKELNRLTGNDDDDGDGSDDDEKKKKGPTVYRLLKTRLQKLVDKTDDTGRVLSVEFMELPNRKMWPMYYTLIKRPQCLENIFKKLKRKEYPKPTDFANDVELVFSNALEFNQEHTQIWEDAVALRDYFRKLMSDLPDPFSIPAYANAGEHPTKIKLRVPHLPAPAQPTVAPILTLPSSNSITIPSSSRASAPKKAVTATPAGPSPRSANAVKAAAVTPAAPLAPTPTPATSSQAPPASKPTRQPTIAPAPPPAVPSQAQKLPHTPAQLPAAVAPRPPTVTATNGASSHAPAAPPLAPAPKKAVAAATHAPAAPTVPASPAPASASARAPTPPLSPSGHFAHPLKHAVLTTLPLYRRLVLDRADGVRTWALRLTGPEAFLVVSDVAFVSDGAAGDGDGESSGDEAAVKRQEEEEEEEEEEEKPVVSSPSKRRSGRSHKRGAKGSKGKAVATVKTRSKGKVAADVPRGEVQVKLNGALMTSQDGGTWEVPVGVGLSVLEVGERGGMVWRVHLDRVAF